MKDIMKMLDSGLLLKEVNETIQNEAKEQKGGFLSMLLGTLGASLLRNMLAGEGINRAGYGNKKGDGMIRVGYGSKKQGFLILPYSLINFEMQKYYHNEPRFNGVYSRDNLSDEIKDRAYIINLDEYSDTGTHCIALFAINDNVTYCDSFGVEHIPKETEKFINGFTIETNIYRIPTYVSVMCGYFYIGFIDFMVKDKSVIDFASLFSPNNFKKTMI